MTPLPDSLDAICQVLTGGDFAIDGLDHPELGNCLLAETPHALVLCVESTWDTLGDTVAEAQAVLTHLAERNPSPRSWDLYLVVAIPQAASQTEDLLREQIEHDTRYARKFVLTGDATHTDAVTRALRPLLPLRISSNVTLSDPLDALRTELLGDGIEADLVDQALASYRDAGEIAIA